MKKILLVVALCIGVFSVKAQNNPKDSLDVSIRYDSILKVYKKEIASKIDIQNKNSKAVLHEILKRMDSLKDLNSKLNSSNRNLKKEVQNNKKQLLKIANSISSLQKGVATKLAGLHAETDSLENKSKALTVDLNTTNGKVSDLVTYSSVNAEKIENVHQNLNKKQLYGLLILGFSLVLLLLVYLVLNRQRLKDSKVLASKQREILEKQLQDSQHLTNWLSEKSETIGSSKDVDHSFAKRVADEIVRISTNLSRMDASIKGFKQLSASLRKLEQTLNSNHYELESLLNKPYNPGMNLQANFVADDSLEEGVSIITRIIKPQINYKGKLIQAAQVEVSQGE